MLKADDDDIRDPGFFSIDDTNLLTNFLHVTDLRLYKIVKWARNLPCFTSTLVNFSMIHFKIKFLFDFKFKFSKKIKFYCFKTHGATFSYSTYAIKQ